MALDEEGPKLTPVGRPTAHNAPAVVALVALAFIVVAVVKPWTFGGRPNTIHIDAPTVSVTASPTQPSGSADQRPRFYPQCYATAGWRLATLQSDEVVEVRTVWPVMLEPATSMAEALEAEKVVYGNNVTGIGFCTPGSDTPTRLAYADRVSLWVNGKNHTLSLVEDVTTIDPLLAESGEVYLGPPSNFGVNGGWPSGEYLFRVDQGGGNATWFALRVVGSERGGPRPTASPVNSPTPAPRRPGSGAGIVSSGHLLVR